MRITYPSREQECGVVILLVALTLLALVIMAALAIDVASFYETRAEARRAADAAALAGAKMFVTSSYTSHSLGWDPDTLCQASVAGSTAAVNQQAELAAKANLIAGVPAQVRFMSCDLHDPTNPRVSVQVQRLGVPHFIRRIGSGIMVATSTAEAYNASGHDVPVQVTGVKPWLIPNCNPNNTIPPLNPKCDNGAYFVDPDSGVIQNSGSFIGKKFCFSRVGRQGESSPLDPSPFLDATNCPGESVLSFYGMNIPFDSAQAACPSTSSSTSCTGVGADDFISNVACASNFVFSCNQTIGPPHAEVSVDLPITYGTGTQTGAQCLIHANSPGLDRGQDIFTQSAGGGAPVSIKGGDNNPNLAFRTANISRSDSLVTVPLYDGTDLCPGSTAGGTSGGGVCLGGVSTTPVGFLQLAITRSMDLPMHFEAIIMNAVGCNPHATGTPINTGVSSPIPVRLVQTQNP